MKTFKDYIEMQQFGEAVDGKLTDKLDMKVDGVSVKIMVDDRGNFLFHIGKELVMFEGKDAKTLSQFLSKALKK